MINKSKVKHFLKTNPTISEGTRISASALVELEERVADLLRAAASRAEANGRRTIMDQDL